MGTDGTRQAQQNTQVDGYGYRFGPPRSCGSGFWMVREANRTVCPVQTRTNGGLPGPIATLHIMPEIATISRTEQGQNEQWIANSHIDMVTWNDGYNE
jgi:hypothetical protein